MKHTITVLVQDRPGVLNRIASVFRRRELNIDSIRAEKTAEPGVSMVQLTVEVEKIQTVVAQLEKLIDVFEVYVENNSSSEHHNYAATSQSFSKWHQADGAA